MINWDSSSGLFWQRAQITAIFSPMRNSSKNILGVASVQKRKIRTPKAFKVFPLQQRSVFPPVILDTMSETPKAPEELPENFEAKVIAQLTVYSSQKDAKGKVKESKAQKTKELVFVFSEDNYVEFLQVLLAKHSQEKYKVTDRWPYTFKYHPKRV